MNTAAKFGNAAVYGNLAYDFTNPEIFADMPPEESPLNPPRARERERTATRARVRLAVSPAAFIGFGIAAVLLVFSLLGRVQLMQTSDEAVALSDRLAALQDEQSKLLIQYESTFNLTEIEKYAKNTLGMQKARGDQIFYVGGRVSDKAVVIAENKTGLMIRLYDLLDGIGELFR
jgi:cell division protein FtsL